ncbi:hypothetical protein ABEB36_007384 [Hypothenemus hampei]|uniref:Uncharacterized protein n=1 Tax=Hypothenemus hampei TaxID=57062 RepID=A0ABD1EUC3_HYPHA
MNNDQNDSAVNSASTSASSQESVTTTNYCRENAALFKKAKDHIRKVHETMRSARELPPTAEAIRKTKQVKPSNTQSMPEKRTENIMIEPEGSHDSPNDFLSLIQEGNPNKKAKESDNREFVSPKKTGKLRDLFTQPKGINIRNRVDPIGLPEETDLDSTMAS